jgi:hypothetical protein
MARRRTPIGKVLIQRVPTGEAPFWVRNAWVGLELPIVLEPRIYHTFGVMSAPKTIIGMLWAAVRGQTYRTTGYPVYSAEAIGLLAETNPEAAEWWRTNAPRFLRPNQLFLFDAAACSPIGGAI